MSGKPRSRLARLCGLLLSLCLTLLTLTASLWYMGTSAAYLHRSFTRYAPPSVTGLREEEYAPIARMTADYLSGKSQVFQYERDLPDSTVFPLFHGYEQEHMADCMTLFRLDRRVGIAALLLLLMSLLFSLLLRRRRETARGMLIGLGLIGAVLLGLALWALADFDGLFVTFHRLAFRNQLWLLNPQTDLLVRLMPLSFFIHCVQVLGASLAAALLLILLCALALRRSANEGETIHP